jgi:hypothetical protein
MAENRTNAVDDALEHVIDEYTFIEFLSALAADRADEVEKERESPSSPYGPGQNGWENGSIEDYLYAAAAWATASINGLPLLPKPKEMNPWRRCADILAAAKVYE